MITTGTAFKGEPDRYKIWMQKEKRSVPRGAKIKITA